MKRRGYILIWQLAYELQIYKYKHSTYSRLVNTTQFRNNSVGCHKITPSLLSIFSIHEFLYECIIHKYMLDNKSLKNYWEFFYKIKLNFLYSKKLLWTLCGSEIEFTIRKIILLVKFFKQHKLKIKFIYNLLLKSQLLVGWCHCLSTEEIQSFAVRYHRSFKSGKQGWTFTTYLSLCH